METCRVWLKPKRSRPIKHHHPWVFSNAVAKVEGKGAIAELFDHDDTPLGWGLYNPKSQIRVRLLEFHSFTPSRLNIIPERLKEAVTLRRTFTRGKKTNAFRLVNSEGDHLTGLCLDVFGETLVLSLLCQGWEEIKKEWLFPALRKVWPFRYLFEKNNLRVRKIEKLSLTDRWLGPKPEKIPFPIQENGLTFFVDPENGQKTGFYLDQRENRALIGDMAEGMHILNLFAYTGSFSVYALKGGARSVENVESSLPALDLAEKNHHINNLSGATFIRGDCFEYLRHLVKQKKRYDCIILDPPALAKSSHQVSQALKGYKDLNLHSMKLLKSGGYLLTCSCSSHVKTDAFLQMLHQASMDAGVSLKILHQGKCSWDHPINPACLDGDYLKAFLVKVL